MECAATTSRTELYTTDAQPASRVHASPDSEVRGRPRRRDPFMPLSISRHHASRESSTLRGRCRHRSASRMNLLTLSRTGTTAAPQRRSHRGDSPERRLLAGVVIVRQEVRRRRGQSPSRSRSPGGAAKAEVMVVSPVAAMAQRRRQRTQSRSRRHGLEGAFASVAQAGRPTLGFERWVAEDEGAAAKD